jgi:hypothetical protein
MAPAALGVPFACAREASLPPGWPQPARLDAPPLLPDAALGSGVGIGAFTRDDGIGLLRLPAGTDRDDYRLLGRDEPARWNVPPSGMAAVDGNLWLDAAPSPLTVVLERDFTLVVRGNFYALRPLHVAGPGRLCIVATVAAGTPFCDRNFDGRWSSGDELTTPAAQQFSGPLEGSGGAWFGLPGLRLDTLDLHCGVVVAGALHVAAERVRIDGPLVLGYGAVIASGARGELDATGARLPRVQRELVPGFLSTGRPRPSKLRPVAGP